jgi:hypothetical protein
MPPGSSTRIPRAAWLLAVSLAAAISANCSSSTGPDGVVSTGSWGGEHALLTIDAGSAAIEFDCAHGSLPAPIALTDGRFDSSGDYVQEHGGPIREGEQVVHRPARYQGAVDGKTMTLTVTVSDTGDRIGSYTLTRGASGRVFKCL